MRKKKNNTKIAYLLKKLVQLVLVLAVLSMAVFVIARLCPGDPLRAYYGDGVEHMSQVQQDGAREKLGLNDSLPVQYGRWVSRFLEGDLGISYKYKQPVTEIIGKLWKNTLILGGISYVLTFGLAILLGMFCALREDRPIDRLICKVGVVSANIPSFFLALILILVFAVNLKLLPVGGAYSYGQAQNWADRILHLILPVTVLVLEHLWYYAYMIRNKLVEEARQDYVLLCKAKGFSRRKIIRQSCMKNIMPSLLVLMAISVPHILGGTYIVESVFAYPGLGTLSFESAMYQDYNMLMALSMLTGAVVVVFHVLAQILGEWIDPRMQYVEVLTEENRGGGSSANPSSAAPTSAVPSFAAPTFAAPTSAAPTSTATSFAAPTSTAPTSATPVAAADTATITVAANAAAAVAAAYLAATAVRSGEAVPPAAADLRTDVHTALPASLRSQASAGPEAGGHTSPLSADSRAGGHTSPLSADSRAGGHTSQTTQAADSAASLDHDLNSVLSENAEPMEAAANSRPSRRRPGGLQRKERSRQGRPPRVSLALLVVIGASCLLAGFLAPYGPDQMDSGAINMAPCAAHLLGTDSMGRDLLTMILYGGRSSLYIGILSGGISTAVAVIYGCISGLASERTSDMMMRFTELVMSVPSVLLILFLQAIWGTPTATSIAIVIATTSWMNISKVVRSEVRQIGNGDYVLAAKTMDASFGYILWRHLMPNFVSSIMFMVVTNIGQAIITESTLSFLGLGLPLTTVSWGSLMSLSQNALLTGSWWIILVPGIVLIITLTCITEIGEYIRRKNNRLHSNL